MANKAQRGVLITRCVDCWWYSLIMKACTRLQRGVDNDPPLPEWCPLALHYVHVAKKTRTTVHFLANRKRLLQMADDLDLMHNGAPSKGMMVNHLIAWEQSSRTSCPFSGRVVESPLFARHMRADPEIKKIQVWVLSDHLELLRLMAIERGLMHRGQPSAPQVLSALAREAWERRDV